MPLTSSFKHTLISDFLIQAYSHHLGDTAPDKRTTTELSNYHDDPNDVAQDDNNSQCSHPHLEISVALLPSHPNAFLLTTVNTVSLYTVILCRYPWLIVVLMVVLLVTMFVVCAMVNSS